MRKSVTLSGFKIDIDTLLPEERIMNYMAKNKYIIPIIAQKETKLSSSTTGNLLRKMTEDGLIRDMGQTTVEQKGKQRHRCHLYGLP